MPAAMQRAAATSNAVGGGGSGSLADVVELILDKGLVIDAFVRVSLVGIEILTIDARIVVASVDTYLRFAEATNRLDLYEGKGGKDLPELTQGDHQGRREGQDVGRARRRGGQGRGHARRSPRPRRWRRRERGGSRGAPSPAAPSPGACRVTATYVYGLVAADTQLPDALHGLGPTGRVSTITHGGLAAIVGDVPQDRPLGQREDLHRARVRARHGGRDHDGAADAVPVGRRGGRRRGGTAGAERGVLLQGAATSWTAASSSPSRDATSRTSCCARSSRRTPQIRQLQERVRAVPEDASYYDRVRLGELIVGALEQRREQDAERLLRAAAAVRGAGRAARAGRARAADRRGVPRRPGAAAALRGRRRGAGP